ncbi:hypothetical protein GCM10023188_32110 [Pontibacter saemangeumensis]|uniref:Uncharacterized protein n=1 Tax=Pontibacter saemangeumensis TaxID=1084525 RepID=A0ABP8LWK6_9BACT
MKVRISGNSIRFRLKQPEVSYFQQHGKITEVTAFGPAPADQLRFMLEVSPAPELAVHFEANTTTIRVPQELAAKWTGTALVGFDGRVDTGKGQQMDLLVEKDFACLDAPEEDNVGTYPNPNAAC